MPIIFDLSRTLQMLKDAKEEALALYDLAGDLYDEQQVEKKVMEIFYDLVAVAGLGAITFMAFTAYLYDQIGLEELFYQRRQHMDH